MFRNLALKAKVFFFFTVVFVAVFAAYYKVYEKLIDSVNQEISPDNTVKYLKEKIKNSQFELISNSYNIRAFLAGQDLSKKKRGPIDTGKVKSRFSYAVVDGSGRVVAGKWRELNSFKGIPSVDRAMQEGVASDGFVTIGEKTFLLGVVPYSFRGAGDSPYGAVVSLNGVVDSFENVEGLPYRIYTSERKIYQNDDSEWLALEKGEKSKEVMDAISRILSGGGVQVVDRWSKLVPVLIMGEGNSVHKLTFVAAVSYMPGLKIYNRLLIYILGISIFAVLVSLLFSFVVTFEIDKILRNIAADISNMRIGEKLLLRKYSYGAGTVVSAINYLISKYEKHGATNPSIMLGAIQAGEKEERFVEEKKVGGTPKVDLPPVAQAVHEEDEEEDEKTQIANLQDLMPCETDTPRTKVGVETLWEEYVEIKRRNNLSVAEGEKSSFFEKLDSNRKLITERYGCRDVQFSIEEKGGKPVVKAKPLR